MFLNNNISVGDNILNIEEGGAPNDQEGFKSQNNPLDQSKINESD